MGVMNFFRRANKSVFVVLEVTGAHEPDPVWAVCTTKEKAEHIASDLHISEKAPYSNYFQVKEVPLNQTVTDWING